MKWCLGFVISLKSNSVILLKKDSKSLHGGLWNGLGGKIEHEEFGHEAMIRECLEESKLNIPLWDYVGRLRDSSYSWRVEIYTINIRGAQLDEVSIPHFWEIQDNKDIGNEPYEVPLIDLPRMQLAPHAGALIYACLEKLRNNNTPILEIKI